MRAAILIGSIDDYGANRVLLQDIEALAALGIDSCVIAPADAILSESQVERIRALGAEVEIFPLHVFRRVDLLGSIGLPMTLPDAARDADIVIAYTLAVVGYLPLARMRGALTILSAHESIEGLPGRALGMLATQADLTIVNSLATAHGLQRMGIATDRMTLIYPSLPGPGDDHPATDTSKLSILVAARVNGAKGQGDAITAVREARVLGVPAELTLAGGPFPGQEEWLVRLQEEVAAGPGVRYVGDLPDIQGLLSEANLLLISSRRPEPFGLVALEAWCAGRRAIGPAEGGALEAMWLVDGVTFEPRNPTSLARQLVRIWEKRDLLNAPDRQSPAARLCSRDRRRQNWAALLGGRLGAKRKIGMVGGQ
jgi:glycosyltransferase involved in cell wall biosynthesis